jgi:hypothetical protein
LALCMVILGLWAAAWPWKHISLSSRGKRFCADVVSRGSLDLGSECCNWGQTSLAVLFCEHVWPTTSRLSRCCSKTFPLHNNSTYSWPGQLQQGRKLMNWLDGKVASYDSAMLKVTEHFSKAILLPMFVNGDCMAVCNFIHLSATGTAEIAESTHLKGSTYFCTVYIVYLKTRAGQQHCLSE